MITKELIKQLTKQQQNNKIYKVELSNRFITQISALNTFSNLRYLELNFNLIKSIQNLGALVDLRELHLSNNQLTQIVGLQNNKMLTFLDLSNNHIQKIENIAHLHKLETFLIDNNYLEKIGGLEGLKDLKNLSISSNKLASIDSLPVFSKLESLNAENNKITKLSSAIFQKSNKLLKLNLRKNMIKEVNFIQQLPSLESLNLEHNQISQLPLGKDEKILVLKNLQYLNIGHNKFETLFKISDHFPELTVFLLHENAISSEYELVDCLSQADFVIEINFLNNPMHTPEFQETLFGVYGFDRINSKDYTKKPGTKYYHRTQQIKEGLKKYDYIMDDQYDRKIKMSGFYNEELETQLTGMKPNRAQSPRNSKAIMNLKYQDFEKAYHDIKENDARIDNLRSQCKHIFEKNGIIIPEYEQKEEKMMEEKPIQPNEKIGQNDQDYVMITEGKPENQLNQKVLEMKKSKENEKKKWAELKNREKNFNIRGVIKKGSASLRKPNVLEGSVSKFPSQELNNDLMKTQINPPRWNNDPALRKTLGYRPLSAKKKIN